MAYVYGSNLDSLSGQRNYYDAMNVRLAEADRAQRQAAVDAGIQMQIAAQRQAEQDRRAMEADALQRQQNYFALNRQASQDVEERRRYATEQKRAGESDVESRRRFDVGTGLQRENIAATKDFNQQRNSDADYVELVNQVSQGAITSPQQIDDLFGHLPDMQRTRAKTYLASAAERQTEEYKQAASAAAAATQAVVGSGTPEKAERHTVFGIPWRPQTVTPAIPPAHLNEQEASMKLATGNRQLAQFLPMLTWDDKAQQFFPIIKKPTNFFASATSPPGGGASPLIQLGPPAPPSAGVTPPYQFGAATNAPATAPVGANTPNPYRVGGLYKGGLIYLGGDPSKPSSWTKAKLD